MGISGNSTYDFYDVLKSDYEAFLNKVQEENGLTRDEGIYGLQIGFMKMKI